MEPVGKVRLTVRILFLNQFFPPDPAPTGLLLREVADAAAARGAEVEFVSAAQDYRSGKKDARRMLRELAGLWRIFCRGMKARRADVVVSGSSPPCLLAVAALVAWKHRARSAHWAMDLYPELAVALGQMREGMAGGFFRMLMRRAYRRTDTVVALDADMSARLRAHGIATEEIRPWVPEPLLDRSGPDAQAGTGDFVWMYSGNLGRAHEWRTLLDAQAILEREGCDITLRFQGGGGNWLPAQERARELGLRRCEWLGYAPEAELRRSLLDADVLVATQKPEASGLVWPSKLAMMLDLPRRIAWVGRADGAVAELLRGGEDNGIFAPGDAAGLARWLAGVRSGGRRAVRRMDDARATREALLAKWLELLGVAGAVGK